MKSKIKKISSALFASLTFLTVGSISPVYATCENAPMSGSKFKFNGPESFKLRVTASTLVDTKNARKLNFLLTQTDRKAQSELAEFFRGVANGTISAENSGGLDFIVAEQDMSEKDKLEGYEKAVLKINTEIKDFDTVGTRKIGQCIEPGKIIVVTREISSDSLFAATSSSTMKDQSTKKEDDVAANENENTDYYKGYKSQVSGGYDGYADMEEF